MLFNPLRNDTPRVTARTIEFLNLLRGVAVLLVVYDHLGAIWPESNGRSWVANRVIRRWVSEPLGIIQDFGFFGVAVFFLISGFVITHVAQRETRLQFAVKRVLRIYPPLIVSILLIIAIAFIQGTQRLSIGEYAQTMTLANYFRVPTFVANAVAWTLVIEMLFYIGVFITLPLLKRWPLVANGCLLGACALIILTARSFGASYFLFAAAVAYVPYLLLGQLVYLRWTRRITTVDYAVFTLATYLVVVFGIRRIHTAFSPADNSYMISVGFAFALFVVALLFEESIRVPAAIARTSEISYSLYLVHGVIGFYVLDVLVGRVPFTAAIVVAFAVAYAVAWASHRFVELPSQRLARSLLARRTATDQSVHPARPRT
ncbi:acyltransferase family protein [Ilumatobacter coccineus]|uniref:Acyltransferase 3 domain-containing protein n=1 Tax=Ilumatobacter coccineus (strain NBRC 103263 / KCTC 29153 / YM16-304) TaxID=1313172 RepID=A0A6C7DY70_ILUCY|nr:acyltransferase [Ilumatobacter coccineus]BAN01264.1 hypothetical protein YM304_09500 [Ilumatobacter coccineus YM16-304]